MPRPPRPSRSPLSGAPPALPGPLDGAVERWWAATPRARWAAGLLLALTVVAAAIGHASASPYGPPTTAYVAARDLLPGTVITSSDLVRRTLPEDVLPEAAVTEPGGVLAATLPAGAILTQGHLGDGGWASGLPPDRVAVSVRAEQLPRLSAGTHLDLVGTDHDGRAGLLGTAAVVLAADDEEVWLAVDAADAVAVSGAAAVGALAVVVLPP